MQGLVTTWKKEARSHEATHAGWTVSTPCRKRTPWWSVWRSIAGRRLARCWQSCCYWLLVFCDTVRALSVPQNVRTRFKTVTMQLNDSTSEQGRHTINCMPDFSLLAGQVYGLGMPTSMSTSKRNALAHCCVVAPRPQQYRGDFKFAVTPFTCRPGCSLTSCIVVFGGSLLMQRQGVQTTADL